ncbi:MAG: SDR family oxidoreductase [Deltaproteobacteria bacterium]|nr:SDR family oxidoreductase [Deltaproteobacteria bacterium]
MQGKTIIVTGAARGIGAAIARRCVHEGATVIGCGLDEKALTLFANEVASQQFVPFRVDVAQLDDIVQFFARMRQENRSLDGLVNNAGVYLGKTLLEYSREEIDHVLTTNINGAVYFSQQFGKYVLGRKDCGVIVNIASVSGQEGSSDAIYGLSKAALIGLTKSCAMNFAPHIRVNAVAPGVVETRMLEVIPKWRLEEYRAHELVKDPIRPEAVANTVAFLLSEQGKHYTGAVFDLNNGCYLR